MLINCCRLWITTEQKPGLFSSFVHEDIFARHVYFFRFAEQFKRSSTQNNYNTILKIQVIERFGLHFCDQRFTVCNSVKYQINKIIDLIQLPTLMHNSFIH